MSTSVNSAASKETDEHKRGRRYKAILLLVMTVCILVPSMLGFVAKFIEFVHTFRESSDGAFAITPIMNYLLASIGFFCMLIWAAINGMFHDMERPKHYMLDLEEKLNKLGSPAHGERL